MDDGQLRDDAALPAGTAIVRPLGHVRAVRERYCQLYAADPGTAVVRSVRAWEWALGEIAAAPVTGRETGVPPSRAEIEAEIAEADGRRLRGDRENHADAAAIVLSWLIGVDDRVPVRCENPGELVGGFGDVVRSRKQLATIAVQAAAARHRAAPKSLDAGLDAGHRELARQDPDYLDGVVMTLAWVLGERAEAPITQAQPGELTAGALIRERGYAEDVVEQGGNRWAADWLPPRLYGEGVKCTITWLLGDSTFPPVDPPAGPMTKAGVWPPAVGRKARRYPAPNTPAWPGGNSGGLSAPSG
jgi:hypothetical protein